MFFDTGVDNMILAANVDIDIRMFHVYVRSRDTAQNFYKRSIRANAVRF